MTFHRRLPSPPLAPLLLAALAISACSNDSPSGPGGPSLRSTHNSGRDCLECHNFSVAGTVYKADGQTVASGATVRLTSAAGGGGTVLLTLTSDAAGNFFTTERVSFGAGLYTDARGEGPLRTMQAAITSGRCNSCHSSGSRITVP